jgi:2',3'-cyclic-nucleotide 2'-phosphodiesterase
MQNKTLRFLFLGDIVGEPGKALFEKWVPQLKRKHKIDSVIVNGENAAKNGRGLMPHDFEFLKKNGASVVTTGNHIWAHKKIYQCIAENETLIRPANYPAGAPGKGYVLFDVEGISVGVINVAGRVFMKEDLDCPFRAVESLLTFLSTKTKIIFIDFHAEATSEKKVFGFHFDGKVSGVMGTHTHVQTADERILPNGTSFISDLGFSGAMNSALGVNKSIVTEHFLTQMPIAFKVAKEGPFAVNGVCVEVDVETGKSLKIERVSIVDDELTILSE